MSDSEDLYNLAEISGAADSTFISSHDTYDLAELIDQSYGFPSRRRDATLHLMLASSISGQTSYGTLFFPPEVWATSPQRNKSEGFVGQAGPGQANRSERFWGSRPRTGWPTFTGTLSCDTNGCCQEMLLRQLLSRLRTSTHQPIAVAEGSR